MLQAVGFQIPQDYICPLILHPKTGLPIGETTLKIAFAEELKKGAANTKMMHAMALWKNVTGGHVTAQIWWDKTRNKIGQNFGSRDHGEDKPETPPIQTETADIVVIARRVAFTLAMGKAKMKADQPLPPKTPPK